LKIAKKSRAYNCICLAFDILNDKIREIAGAEKNIETLAIWGFFESLHYKVALNIWLQMKLIC
jgi:hypothetical protein